METARKKKWQKHKIKKKGGRLEASISFIVENSYKFCTPIVLSRDDYKFYGWDRGFVAMDTQFLFKMQGFNETNQTFAIDIFENKNKQEIPDFIWTLKLESTETFTIELKHIKTGAIRKSLYFKE